MSASHPEQTGPPGQNMMPQQGRSHLEHSGPLGSELNQRSESSVPYTQQYGGAPRHQLTHSRYEDPRLMGMPGPHSRPGPPEQHSGAIPPSRNVDMPPYRGLNPPPYPAANYQRLSQLV